jgi:hypothetical protein
LSLIEKARLRPLGYDVAAFATKGLAWPKLANASEGWWSQAGSNRRPRHCERRALPAELWPQIAWLTCRRVDKWERLTIGAIYRPRQGQVKNGEIVVFPILYRELPLFARDGTDI